MVFIQQLLEHLPGVMPIILRHTKKKNWYYSGFDNISNPLNRRLGIQT